MSKPTTFPSTITTRPVADARTVAVPTSETAEVGELS